MANREERIQIFNDTLNMCKKNDFLKESVAYSIGKQMIYWEGDTIDLEGPRFNMPAKVILSSKRTIEAASSLEYRNKKIGVLNFASSINPGGGVLRGTRTQEESICRISTLYPAIADRETAGSFYQNHREWIHGGVMGRRNRDDCIYTPKVTVFRKDDFECDLLPEEQWFQVDVITCAAPDQRFDAAGKSYRPSFEELEHAFVQRIEMIIRIAAYHQIDVLILGAFGCGAFGNSPYIVAKAFERVVTKYAYYFECVEFAVYSMTREDDNYKAFLEINGIQRMIVK